MRRSDQCRNDAQNLQPRTMRRSLEAARLVLTLQNLKCLCHQIVEDDGPETPEDQGTPRVLNRSVQEIPRESADRGAGQEANLPVRNFGPRPASAYGPRGSAPSAGGFARREVNWGETPGEASTSGSPNNQGGLPKAGNGGGGSGFANGFDNRPWSAGSAPGTGLHSGALDGDFDRRSVDLGPVRLAKTGSFGSRGGSKGSGMSKEEFRVHFENAEPAVRASMFDIKAFVITALEPDLCTLEETFEHQKRLS